MKSKRKKRAELDADAVSKKRAKLMSAIEYARHRGVSKVLVYAALKSGRISPANPGEKPVKIDPAVADPDWDAFRDESRDSKSADDEADDADGEIDSTSAAQEMRIAKAKRERWLAKQARLDYLEKSGKLIPASRVEKQAFHLARIVRDHLLSLPDRVSAELCGISDQPTLHARLTEEINSALRELVESKKAN